jgi:hypothetical protein
MALAKSLTPIKCLGADEGKLVSILTGNVKSGKK